MYFLFKFQLFYLFYFGIIWGYVTFLFNSQVNKFIETKRLLIWNRIMTILVLALCSLNFYVIFQNTPIDFESLSGSVVNLLLNSFYCKKLIKTCHVQKIPQELANLALKLQISLNFSEKTYKKLSTEFINIFIIDMGAIVIVLNVAVGSIGKFDMMHSLIVYSFLFFTVGTKLLISSYIFLLNFATQLMENLNSNLIYK